MALQYLRQLQPRAVIVRFDSEVVAEPVRRLGVPAARDQHVLPRVRRLGRNVADGEDRMHQANRCTADRAVDHEYPENRKREVEDEEEGEHAPRNPTLVEHEEPQHREHDVAGRAEPRRHAEQLDAISGVGVLGTLHCAG